MRTIDKIVFENKKAYWEIKEGILYGTLEEDIIITLPLAKKISKDRIAFQKQENIKNIPAIVNLKIKYINKEARVYLSKEGVIGLSAAAIITKNLAVNTLMKVFLVIEKPAIPTKMFENEETAALWIKDFVV